MYVLNKVGGSENVTVGMILISIFFLIFVMLSSAFGYEAYYVCKQWIFYRFRARRTEDLIFQKNYLDMIRINLLQQKL
jgi:hypothetical protein